MRDRGRDPRRRRQQARLAPGADARAARGAGAVDARAPLQRIGLSATQRPIEEIARFLGGASQPEGKPRPVTIVEVPADKPLDLEVIVPVADLRDPETDPDAAPIGLASPSAATPPAGARSGPASIRACSSWSREHSSTIVFVNNRRLAERLALRLNDLAERGGRALPPRLALARGAHRDRGGAEGGAGCAAWSRPARSSSASTWARSTWSIQIESPKSVARGLQRDRSRRPHAAAVSKGRIFPKFRADLVECAVVVEADARGRDRGDGDPAQAARRARPADRRDGRRSTTGPSTTCTGVVTGALSRTRTCRARSSRTCSTCSTAAIPRRSSPSCGRGSPGTASRARCARGAARRSWRSPTPGTIPDRGLYGVHLPDGRRVGELDEEMVYEARAGQAFRLGSTTWRIEEITRDRVIVTPAPEVPGRDSLLEGRRHRPPVRARARRSASLPARAERDAAASGRSSCCAATTASTSSRPTTCYRYLDEQRDATRVVPSDRTVVVERFRDEIGDWRLCVLTPFGGRVHAAWAMAISARLRDERGLDPDAIWSDDGVILHLPDADEPPPAGRRAARPRRGRGPGHRRARQHGAVRLALPRGGGALAADPAPQPGPRGRRCGSSG